MRVLGLFCAALVALVGCGRTTQSGSTSATVEPVLQCEGTLPPGELQLQSDDASAVSMGPCGELSFTSRAGDTYLLDSSLTAAEQLYGVTVPARFDPQGRGAFYVQDAGTEAAGNEGSGTLVYRELRGAGGWNASLPVLSDADKNARVPDKAVRPIDFYAREGRSGLFSCQGTTFYDYDDAGQATAHDLGLMCARALYSVRDALFLAPDVAAYQSVTLGIWQARRLAAPGYCDADLCERKLVRKVLTKSATNYEFVGGDAATPVYAGETRYNAETGEEVGYGAMTTPEGRVVDAPGFRLYQDEEDSVAITDDSPEGATRTTLRYFGPNPQASTRWLASSITLEPRRGTLHALPSSDLQRVVVWDDTCDANVPKTLFTFAPGQNPRALDIEPCVTKVHWVGNDGALLVTLFLLPTQGEVAASFKMALIDAQQGIHQLELDDPFNVGASQAVAGDSSLVISMGTGAKLYVIDLQTAAVRELGVAAGPLLVDAAHERLAFRVSLPDSSGKTPLWAGAFPQ